MGADHATGGPVRDCGHFIPEERPDRLLDALLEFLDRSGGERSYPTATDPSP